MAVTARNSFIFFSLIFVLAVVSVAYAQEDFDDAEEELIESEEEVLVEDRAGITPDSPLYVFDKVIDEAQLRASSGEKKAKKALEIKEERLAEASVMVDSSKADNAKDALLLAAKASKIAQAEIAPDLEKETNDNVRKAAMLLTSIKSRIPGEGWEDIEAAIETQLDEEEKTRIALIVSKSRLRYCDSLAKQDIYLMKSDPQCDIEKVPYWLKGKIEGEFNQRDEQARRQIIDVVSMCVLDPKQCDCSKIPVARHVESCELNKALAIRCDYENDAEACDKLDEAEEEFFDLLGEEGAKTVRELLKKKEGDFFEDRRPPECADAATFEECFDIMTGLYGMPPFCKGISEDECMELIKENPKLVEEGMPPECKDAGVASPKECARKMMHKYGSPPECVGMDADACIDLMMKKGPEHVGGPGKGMPPECEGINEPRECFNIMNKKYGMPPFCEGLSDDECFEEIMKKEGNGPEGHGMMPPECEEAGVTGPRECFDIMNQKYGPPRFCEGMSDDECFEETMKRGPEEPGKGGGPEYMPPECEAAGKTSQRECTRLIMELYGLPMDVCPDMGIDECVEVMIKREHEPGGKTLELCIGISPEECRKKMQKEHGPPMECEGLSQNECVELMHDKGGMPGGTPLECAGLGPEECERVMMDKYAPPECKGLDKEACDKLMRERQGDFKREFEGEHGSVIDICEGLPREECEQRMMERFAPRECEALSPKECSELMRRGEVSGSPSEFRQPRDEMRLPSGAPEGIPQGCEGLSPDECGRLMNEKRMPEQRYVESPREDELREFENGGRSGSGFNYGSYSGDADYEDSAAYRKNGAYDRGYDAPDKRFDDSPGGSSFYEATDRSGSQSGDSYGQRYDSSKGDTGFYRSDDKGFGDVINSDAYAQEPREDDVRVEPKSQQKGEGENHVEAQEIFSEITGSVIAFAEWLKR